MNTPESQKKFVKMMKVIQLEKKYKEMYGADWKQVYEEDKENNCLLKDE